jgi:hypothetical protein
MTSLPQTRSADLHRGFASIGLHLVLASILAVGFYVYLRSFPLLSEDGAFSYMSLMQSLNSAHPISRLFGFNLAHGLGQPDAFFTVIFDPFNWPMLLVRYGDETAENYLIVFQLTMALRGIVCWIGTYVMAAAAFPYARTPALTAAYLNLILSFFLVTNFGGTENHAGIPNGTEAALLPLLIGLYLRGVRLGNPLLCGNSLAIVVLLFFCIHAYPIASMMGVALVVGVAATIVVAGGAQLRRSAIIHLLGLVAAVAVILFLPGLESYRSWQNLVTVSSRVVFGGELEPLFRAQAPPKFWYAPPFATRLLALLAVASLLIIDRVPPISRSIMTALALMVAGIQLVGLAANQPVLARFVHSLPPLDRVETFFPPLYAFCAAISLYAGERLLLARGGWRLFYWCSAAVALMAATVYMFDGAYDLLGWTGLVRSWHSEVVIWSVGASLALGAAVNALRVLTPNQLPRALRRTAGAIGPDRGGSELFHATLCAGFVVLAAGLAFRMWASNVIYLANYVSRYAACDHLTVLGCRDSDIGRGVNAGTNPVVGYLRERLAATPLFTGRAEFLSAYNPAHLDIVSSLQERQRNFEHGGNGMVLSSLSFNGVPTASVYEQSHDYLYYLFWTRFLMADSHFRFTPNWTSLYRFAPNRLALAGVRYVITRRENEPAIAEAPLAFAWDDYVVTELADANTRGYAVGRILIAPTLADELRLMTRADFDPKHDVVVADSGRPVQAESILAPLAASEITTRHQVVHFGARSAGGASLVVLPFRYSHCWVPEWHGPPGTLLRADEALLAVYFADAVDVSLEWRGGYGRHAECLREDAELIPQARAAAERLPY